MAEKLYQRINFEDAPSINTPLSADILNLLDKGVDDLDNKIVSMFNKKLLATGPSHLTEEQTLYFSQKVSEQQNGIAFVFSLYDSGNKVPLDYNFQCFFVPKHQVAAFNGLGHNFLMVNNSIFSKIASKYVYIYDDKIVGNKDNLKSGTSNGITYNNNSFVLRYVIGV